MRIYLYIKQKVREYLIDHYPIIIVNHEWPHQFGHKLNWKSPRDLNEKIQWLICKSDTSNWSLLADKYRVRDYVSKIGYKDLLTKLYGVWDNAQNIIFDELPQKFVLKCNHDSGSTIIIDKNKGYDEIEIKHILNKKLKQKFGYVGCEPHYNKIIPKIIAEEYLQFEDINLGQIDYKIWCLSGKPYCILVCHSRQDEHVALDLYDLQWNNINENLVFCNIHRDGKNSVKKPELLHDMIKCAEKLSEGFPQVRVDFYISKGKLYFGELTFTSYAGRMKYFTDAFLKEMGDLVELPSK